MSDGERGRPGRAVRATVEPGWTVLRAEDVERNSGRAFEIRRGQRIRVIGRTIVDLVAFDLHDLTHRFDQARTKSNQAKIFVSTGDALYSKRNRPMLEIVHDGFTEGRHDLQKGMCSRERFLLVAKGTAKRVFTGGAELNPTSEAEIPDHGCWENLTAVLEGRGIADVDIPSPFNIFQTMEIDPETGAMLDTTVRPAEPTTVDLEALMDCLVAVSACPESGRGQAIRVEILDRAEAPSDL